MGFGSFPPGVFSSLRSKCSLIPEEQVALVAVLALVARLGTPVTGRFRLIALGQKCQRRAPISKNYPLIVH